MENNNNNPNPPEKKYSFIEKALGEYGKLFLAKIESFIKSDQSFPDSARFLKEYENFLSVKSKIEEETKNIEEANKEEAELQKKIREVSNELKNFSKEDASKQKQDLESDQDKLLAALDKVTKARSIAKGKRTKAQKKYDALKKKLDERTSFSVASSKEDKGKFSVVDKKGKELLDSIVVHFEDESKNVTHQTNALDELEYFYDSRRNFKPSGDVKINVEEVLEKAEQVLMDLAQNVGLGITRDRGDEEEIRFRDTITQSQHEQLIRERSNLGSIITAQFKIPDDFWKESSANREDITSAPIVKTRNQSAFLDSTTNEWYTTDKKSGDTFKSKTIVFPKKVEELGDYNAESVVATTQDGEKFRIPTFGKFSKKDIAYSKDDNGRIQWYRVSPAKKGENGYGRIAEIGSTPYDEETKGGAIFVDSEDVDIIPDDALEGTEKVVDTPRPEPIEERPEPPRTERPRPFDVDDILEEYNKPLGEKEEERKEKYPRSPDQQRPYVNNSFIRLKRLGEWSDSFASILGEMTSWRKIVDNPELNPILNEAGQRKKETIKRRPKRDDIGRKDPKTKDFIPFEASLYGKTAVENPNDVIVDATGYGGALPSDVTKYYAPWGHYAGNDSLNRNVREEASRYRDEAIAEAIFSRRQGATIEYIQEVAKRLYGVSLNEHWLRGMLPSFGFNEADPVQRNKRQLYSLTYRLRDLYEEDPESGMQQIAVADASLSGKLGGKAQGVLEAVDAITSTVGLNMRLTSFSKGKPRTEEGNTKATWLDVHMPGSSYNRAKKKWEDRVEASKQLKKAYEDQINGLEEEEKDLQKQLEEAEKGEQGAPDDKKEEFVLKQKDIKKSLEKNSERQEKLRKVLKNNKELDALLEQEGRVYERGENPSNSYSERWREGARQAAKTLEDVFGYTGDFTSDKVNPDERTSADTRSKVGDSYEKIVTGIAKQTAATAGATSVLGKFAGSALKVVLAFEAVKAAVGWFVKLNKEIENVIREFANFSSLTAVAARWFEAKEYQRTLKEAQALEESRAGLAKAWSDLKDETQPLIIAFKKLTNEVLIVIDKILTVYTAIMKSPVGRVLNPIIGTLFGSADDFASTEEKKGKGFFGRTRDIFKKESRGASLNPFYALYKVAKGLLGTSDEDDDSNTSAPDLTSNIPNSWIYNYTNPEKRSGVNLNREDFFNNEDALERVHKNIMARGAALDATNKLLGKANKKKALEEFEKQAEALGFKPTEMEKDSFVDAYKQKKGGKQKEGLLDEAAYYGLVTGKEVYLDGAFRDEDYLKQLLKKLDSQHIAIIQMAAQLGKIDPKLAQIVKDAGETAKNTRKEPDEASGSVILDFLRNGENLLNNGGKKEWKGDVQKGWGEDSDKKDKATYGRFAQRPQVEWR